MLVQFGGTHWSLIPEKSSSTQSEVNDFGYEEQMRISVESKEDSPVDTISEAWASKKARQIILEREAIIVGEAKKLQNPPKKDVAKFNTNSTLRSSMTRRKSEFSLDRIKLNRPIPSASSSYLRPTSATFKRVLSFNDITSSRRPGSAYGSNSRRSFDPENPVQKRKHKSPNKSSSRSSSRVLSIPPRQISFDRIKIIMKTREDDSARKRMLQEFDDNKHKSSAPMNNISASQGNSKATGRANVTTSHYSNMKSRYLQDSKKAHNSTRCPNAIDDGRCRKIRQHLTNTSIDPIFIPNYNASSKYLDELVHHSKQFILLENKFLFNCDDISSRSASAHCPYFPCNWRSLSKDDLIDACKKLLLSVDKTPTSENLSVLYALLHSSYLLQYFVYLNIIPALSNWILSHPPSIVAQWHLRILRKTKWNSIYGVENNHLQCNIYFTKELQDILFDIALHRDEVDPFLSTKAFSVLRSNLPHGEIVKIIRHLWRDTVKKGFSSTYTGSRLLANNVLHTIKKYQEAGAWNIHNALVSIVTDNVDDEETLKAIENLIHISRYYCDDVILAGGFKLISKMLQHEKMKIRSHILLLLRIICENASRQFMIFPYNMNIIYKFSDLLTMSDDIPLQITANAFHAIVLMLKDHEFNNNEKIQDFHVVHTQVAAQKIIHHNFGMYNETIEDLVIGASNCLHLCLLGSIERATYALNSGILQRVLHILQTGPTSIYVSLLKLLIPVCSSRLSTEIVFEVDDHLLNPLVERLRRLSNHKDSEIRKVARNALYRLAEIMQLDTFNLFKDYTPSNAKYRYMGIPEDVMERTRKDSVYLKSKEKKRVIEHIKKIGSLLPENRPTSAHSSKRSLSRIEDLDIYKYHKYRMNSDNYFEIDEDFFKKNSYTEVEELRELIQEDKKSQSFFENPSECSPNSKSIKNSHYACTPKFITTKTNDYEPEMQHEIKEDRSQLTITVTNNDAVLAFKNTPQGVKSLELLRMCSYCANTSFTIVYKCFYCDTMFCSSECRKEALENCHLKCKLH